MEGKEENKSKTYSDTVPVLVHHHHAQKHAESEEEKTVDVVLDSIAYRHAEGEQENLS